eukprot:TRINITY_DN8007_c0_g1_i3.p1 TRINITY_DN8007_c0_g1~~TRINITY_DN8007_c0_g1_i3.p1  ORF type:complete len:290 (-),score=85.24 TRINITY_DN8007_c0_g1_i3:528-1397(-)
MGKHRSSKHEATAMESQESEMIAESNSQSVKKEKKRKRQEEKEKDLSTAEENQDLLVVATEEKKKSKKNQEQEAVEMESVSKKDKKKKEKHLEKTDSKEDNRKDQKDPKSKPEVMDLLKEGEDILDAEDEIQARIAEDDESEDQNEVSVTNQARKKSSNVSSIQTSLKQPQQDPNDSDDESEDEQVMNSVEKLFPLCSEMIKIFGGDMGDRRMKQKGWLLASAHGTHQLTSKDMVDSLSKTSLETAITIRDIISIFHPVQPDAIIVDNLIDVRPLASMTSCYLQHSSPL